MTPHALTYIFTLHFMQINTLIKIILCLQKLNTADDLIYDVRLSQLF